MQKRRSRAGRTRPLVSVIIPAYNGSGTIAKAVSSVLAQDIPLEIIIVDDCSDDDLQRALLPFSGCGCLKLLRNKENLGVARSRNRGVRHAEGKFVAFLDCDDWWEKDKLKRQLYLMKKTGCVLCSTARRLVTPDGVRKNRVIHVKPHLKAVDLMFQNPVTCSSVVVRRDVALRFPMTHDECHEDYLTWYNIIKTYHHACAVDLPLVNYRLSNAGKSGNKLKSAKMTYQTYRHMGFDPFLSAICFAGYALNGVYKYFF